MKPSSRIDGTAAAEQLGGLGDGAELATVFHLVAFRRRNDSVALGGIDYTISTDRDVTASASCGRGETLLWR